MIVQEDNVPTSYDVDSIDVQLARHKDKLDRFYSAFVLSDPRYFDQTIYFKIQQGLIQVSMGK